MDKLEKLISTCEGVSADALREPAPESEFQEFENHVKKLGLFDHYRVTSSYNGEKPLTTIFRPDKSTSFLAEFILERKGVVIRYLLSSSPRKIFTMIIPTASFYKWDKAKVKKIQTLLAKAGDDYTEARNTMNNLPKTLKTDLAKLTK